MARYDLLLCDADETLLDFSGAEKNAFRQAMAAFGLPGGEEAAAVYSACNLACWKRFERGELTLTRLRVQRFLDFFRAAGLSADPGAVSAAYEEALSRQGGALPGAAEALAAWEGRLRVLVLTNGIARVQRGRFAKSPFPHLARDMVVSEEVGVRKPDPEIVRLAMRRAGIHDPGRVLLLGDSLTSDMGAAANAGVDGCWYNPKKNKNTGLPVRYEIDSLSQVEALL